MLAIELVQVELRGDVLMEQARAFIGIFDAIQPLEQPPAARPHALNFEALRPLVEGQATDVPGRQVAQVPSQRPTVAHSLVSSLRWNT